MDYKDETDYKNLYLHGLKDREAMEARLSKKQDTIEDLERELADAKRRIVDLEDEVETSWNTAARLRGEIKGLQYAIRNNMVGDSV